MKTSVALLLSLKDYLKEIYPDLTTWTTTSDGLGLDVCPPYVHTDSLSKTSFLVITLRPNLQTVQSLESEDNLKSSFQKKFEKDLVTTSIYRLPLITRTFHLIFSPMAIVAQHQSCRSLISISLVSHLGHLIEKEFVKLAFSFGQNYETEKIITEFGVSEITMSHSELLWKIYKQSKEGLTVCSGIAHKTHKSLSPETIYIEPTLGADHIVRSRRCSFVLDVTQETTEKMSHQCFECSNLDSKFTDSLEEFEEIVYEKSEVVERQEVVPKAEKSVPNLVCTNCGTIFLYKSSFDKHYLNCTAEKRQREKGLFCKTCKGTYSSVSALLTHAEDCRKNQGNVKTVRKIAQKLKKRKSASKIDTLPLCLNPDPILRPVDKEKEVVCYVCLRNYHSKERFQDHLRVHEHDIPELMQQTQCPIENCIEVFDNRPDLNLHFMENHANNDLSDKILCLKCLAPVSRDKIRRHFRIEHPNRTYPCEDCERICLYPSQLKAHRKEMHDPNNVKPFICHLCGNIYSRVTGLSQHMLNQHSDQRQFQCKFCQKGFTSIQRLHQHERIHTGDKPFKCSICGYRSTRKDNVQLHLRKVHKVNPKSTFEQIEILNT